MAKFVTIGERIHCISPAIRKAMAERDPEPILKRAKEMCIRDSQQLSFQKTLR